MSDRPAVAVAMVNWKGWPDALECLDSLVQVEYSPLHVYLCDNASGDDSVGKILGWGARVGWETTSVDWSRAMDHAYRPASHQRPARLTVIRNDANDGFARGTNIAIRCALASATSYEFIWTLNTDTLVDAKAVTAAIDVCHRTPTAGSVQSILVGCPDDHLVDSAGFRLLVRGGARDLFRRSRVDQLPANVIAGPARVFGACAASAFYRTSALASVGLFDERLFQTNEDVDLACRLTAAGYDAWLAPTSVVRHKGGISRRRNAGRMWFITHRAKLLVVARWWPRIVATPAVLVGTVRAFVAMVRAPGVRAGEWWEVVRSAIKELVGGATESTRRAVLAAGRQGLRQQT